MKRLQPFLVILLIALSFNAVGQNRANFWHFGNGAGMEFTAGDPVGITSAFPFDVEEGTSSIAKADGSNFLFYSDGRKIYDADNELMPNGSGLSGNGSSQQSCVIIPHPTSTDEYYVFTQGGEAGGLAYSIIDMNLPGNGTTSNPKGDIGLTKNIRLRCMWNHDRQCLLTVSLIRHSVQHQGSTVCCV